MILPVLLPLSVILAHIGYIRLTSGRLNPFSIFLLLDLALYFLFVHVQWEEEKRFNTPEEAFAFNSLLALGILALYAGLHGVGTKRDRRTFEQQRQIVAQRIDRLRVLFPWALLLFCGSTASIVFVTVRQAGVSFWSYFGNERLSAYLDANSIDGGLLMSAAYFSMVSVRPILLIWICVLWAEKKWLFGGLVYGVVLLAILSIFRTRLEVLTTLAIPVVFYHYFRRPITVWQFCLGFFCFLVLQASLNIWRGMGVSSLTSGDVDIASYYSASLSQDLNPSRALIDLWRMNREGRLEHEYGLNYWYTVVSFVPRGLWPEKPVTSLEVRWTLLLREDVRGGIHTFTVFGEGLIQFGPMGFVLGALLYGAILGWLQRHIAAHPALFLCWFYFSVLAATYVRASVQALIVLLVLFWLLVGVLVFIPATSWHKRIAMVMRQ